MCVCVCVCVCKNRIWREITHKRMSPLGVVANVLDWDILASKFELHSPYNFH